MASNGYHHHAEASDDSVIHPEITLEEMSGDQSPVGDSDQTSDAIALDRTLQDASNTPDGEADLPGSPLTTVVIPQTSSPLPETKPHLPDPTTPTSGIAILLSSDQSDTPQEHNLDTQPEISSSPAPASSPYVGSDDIVDMVNLLESGSKSRRLSFVSIPDDVHEIPDEE